MCRSSRCSPFTTVLKVIRTGKRRNLVLHLKMSLKAMIGPSVLNADLSQLYDESQRLLDNGADYLVSCKCQWKLNRKLFRVSLITALGCDGWTLCAEPDVWSSDCEVFEEQD